MPSITKDVFINKLADIVHKYNNTYHNTTKMKPVNVNQAHALVLLKNNNNKKKDFNFKIGDHLRISKYKNICKRLRSKLV